MAAKKHRRILAGLVIWAAACAAAILLPFTDIIELKALDVRFARRGTVAPVTPILIVSIDDDSLDAIGTQWSTIRSYLAKAIDTISAGGARAIGLDILLIDPSITQQDDVDLAASMRRSGRVVVVSRFHSRSDSESEFELVRLDKPIPVFEGTYHGMGYANFLLDDDRFVRRLKLVEVHNDRPQYPFSLAVLACAENKPLGMTAGGMVTLDGQAIAGTEAGVICINYAGPPGTFETISLAKVLNGEAPKGCFRNRIVLIGAEMKDKSDLIHTPFTAPLTDPGGMYGVEVHANAINTLASGGFIRSTAGWQKLVLVFLVSAIAIILLTTLRPLVGLGAALGLGVVFFGASVLLFSWSRLLVRLVEPLLAVFICCVGALLYRYLLEEREKRAIKNVFSRFVSPKVVEQILRDEEGVQLGGEIRTVTVFFSDIRGFTPLSATMTPDRVVSMLNGYFREMVEIIFQFGGTLNKFIGDAIMAIYGAPLPIPDAEERAVRACLRMRETLQRFNDDRAAGGQEPIRIGMALHRGEVLVGNIGSPRQMEYTAIGDVVNVCSRLEGITKKLKTDFVVSDDIYRAVDRLIEVESPPPVMVKGKTEPIQVHKVLRLKEA